MRYRQLSPSGDFVFGQGQQNFLINSPSAVAQKVQTLFKLWQGEWYLNTIDGTPWLENVFGYHANRQETTDQALIAVALSVEEVEDVTNWSSTYDPTTRTYSSITATLDTIFGQTQLEIANLSFL